MPVGDGPITQELMDEAAERFHQAHRELYGYDFRNDPHQHVEWVNLRVSGIGPIKRPELAEIAPGTGADDALTGTRQAYFDEWVTTACTTAPASRRRRTRRSRRDRGVQLDHPGSSRIPRSHRHFRQHPPQQDVRLERSHPMTATLEPAAATTRKPFRLTDASGSAPDPVLVEIVAGYLASVEMEVETSISRTSRSPMIRDAHDFRAGIHDRNLRKLTGRSYSALVHPVARDFPLETMKPGDVFFHNDVYLSEGGIGHLPDLCVTVPVFATRPGDTEPSVVAFVQAFGHHDDIGGCCPGSMPSGATTVYEEGLMVPPIKLWDQAFPTRRRCGS